MIEIVLLLIIFSLDTLIVSMTYSLSKINISNKSILIISLICSISVLISFIISNFLKLITSSNISNIISFIILFLLGAYNLFQEKIKQLIPKNDNKVLKIYLDEKNADFDKSKNIDYKESIMLAIILSIDSLFGGISIGFMEYNILIIALMLFIINIIFIKLGSFIGAKFRYIINFNTSYIIGFTLIFLAFLRII